MIGKASEIKTKLVDAHYEYPLGDYSVKNRRWISLEQALNDALISLGDAEILSIRHTSQVYGETTEVSETALIIYKEAKQ